MPRPRLVIDSHHVGAGQTGNETWSWNVARELVGLADPGELVLAGIPQGLGRLAELGPETAGLAGRSAVRLARDLPRVLRKTGAGAYLAHYTPALSLVPAVMVVHDFSAWDPQADAWLGRRTRLRYQASITVACRLAHTIVVPSHFSADDARRRLGARRVVVAPNALDPDLLARLSDPRPAARSRSTVLAVGTVLPRKDLLTAARAVRALRDAGDDVTLRVVGPVRPAGDAMAAEMRALLGPGLVITGHVSDADLAEEYRTAAVLAFPSLYEGFGIPVVEAMAAGCPVVVSDRGALPEVAGEAGLVAAAGDVRAWAQALQRAMADPALPQRGRDQAATFSWRRSAEKVLGALRTAASPRPGAGR